MIITWFIIQIGIYHRHKCVCSILGYDAFIHYWFLGCTLPSKIKQKKYVSVTDRLDPNLWINAYFCLIDRNTCRFITNIMKMKTPCSVLQMSDSKSTGCSGGAINERTSVVHRMPITMNNRRYNEKRMRFLLTNRLFCWVCPSALIDCDRRISTAVKMNNTIFKVNMMSSGKK